MDEGEASKIRTFIDLTEVSEQPIPELGDNGIGSIVVDKDGVNRLEVDFDASGAVASFVYCPAECIECEVGPDLVKLQIADDSSSRNDDLETIRVYQDTSSGGTDIPTSDPLFVGNNIHDIDDGGSPFTVGDVEPIVPGGDPLVITVQGPSHENEYVKAFIPTDCRAAPGYSNTINGWITVEVVETFFDSERICPIPSEPCIPGYYKDWFGNNAFDNQDGSLDWTGPWVEEDEVGADQSPLEGNVRVGSGSILYSNSVLKLTDEAEHGDLLPSVYREADLRFCDRAVLNYEYATNQHHWSNNFDSNDKVVVEISSDGGATWTVLKTIQGWQWWDDEYHDITAYASETTQVRFRVESGYGEGTGAAEIGVAETGTIDQDKYFYVDWVKIKCECPDGRKDGQDGFDDDASDDGQDGGDDGQDGGDDGGGQCNDGDFTAETFGGGDDGGECDDGDDDG